METKEKPEVLEPESGPIDQPFQPQIDSKNPAERHLQILSNQIDDFNETDSRKKFDSGLSFFDLFEVDSREEDIQEIFEAVRYLLQASQGDLTKIRRFYVTVVVLAIHSSSLNVNVKNALRKYFQLTDESAWRQNPLLKLCESFLLVQTDKHAGSTVAFRVDPPMLNAILTFRAYLAEAVRAGVPRLEPWDLESNKARVRRMIHLIDTVKGESETANTSFGAEKHHIAGRLHGTPDLRRQRPPRQIAEFGVRTGPRAGPGADSGGPFGALRVRGGTAQ